MTINLLIHFKVFIFVIFREETQFFDTRNQVNLSSLYDDNSKMAPKVETILEKYLRKTVCFHDVTCAFIMNLHSEVT